MVRSSYTCRRAGNRTRALEHLPPSSLAWLSQGNLVDVLIHRHNFHGLFFGCSPLTYSSLKLQQSLLSRCRDHIKRPNSPGENNSFTELIQQQQKSQTVYKLVLKSRNETPEKSTQMQMKMFSNAFLIRTCWTFCFSKYYRWKEAQSNLVWKTGNACFKTSVKEPVYSFYSLAFQSSRHFPAKSNLTWTSD